MRVRPAIAALALLGAGCSSEQQQLVQQTAVNRAGQQQATEKNPETEDLARQLVGPGPWVAHSENFTLQVENPASASRALRTVLIEAGAKIHSSSVDARNRSAHLYFATRPGDEMQTVLDNLRAEVTNNSSSTSDQGQRIRELAQRLRLLRLADAKLQGLLQQTKETQELDALLLLRSMNAQERQRAEQQLRAYREQVGWVQYRISFTHSG